MASVRTLDQIIAELNPTYQPQVQSIQNQMGLIPGQIATGEAQLGAKKDQAYEDILLGARRRGTGIASGGIPLGEQAKYAATEYMPALARFREAGVNQATSLQDALNAIQEKKMTLGQNIYQTEQQRAYEAEQAQLNRDAQQRAAATSASNAITPTMLSQLLGQQTTNKQTARVEQPTPGGFAFYSADNKPITAGTYATSTGQDLRDVLYEMGSAGDYNASKLYNQLRLVPNDNIGLLNSTMSSMAKQYPHIFNGYVVGGPYAPLGGR